MGIRIKPIVFSNLRRVTLDWCPLLLFLSVTHPVLTHITVDGASYVDLTEYPKVVELAKQPNVKYLKIVDCPFRIFSQIMNIVSVDLLKLVIELQDYPVNYSDFSNFSRIETLKCKVNENGHADSIAGLFKSNKILKANISGCSVSQLIPDLQYITHLTLEKLDSNDLSQLLQIPSLQHLCVTDWSDSYAKLTSAIHMSQPIHLTTMVINNVLSFRNESELVHIIPPMEHLKIDLNIFEYNLEYYLIWILILITTINVTELHCRQDKQFLEKIPPIVFNKDIEYYKSKQHFSIETHLIKKIKKQVNEILENDYLKPSNEEKITIKNKISRILDYMKNKRTVNPVINELIVHADEYLHNKEVEYIARTFVWK
jgi:hypothetical protein